MKSFMARTLVLVIAALAAYSLVLAGMTYFGMGRILSVWETRENENLSEFVRTKLQALADESFSTRTAVAESLVSSALDGLPYDPSWVVVVNARNAVLYHYRRADVMGQGRYAMRRFQDITDWREVRYPDGTLAFRYSSLVPGFDEEESNRLLLLAAWYLLGTGAIAAFAIAFFLAFLFARPMANQAVGLSKALERMSAGERSLALPGGSVTELDRIAKSAGILQASLSKEESLRRQWAADIAHDLRTPVSVLKGQIEGFQDGVLQPTPGRLETAAREIATLERLIVGLGLLTTLESPGFSPRFGTIEPGDLLASIANRFAEKASERGVRLLVEADGEAIRADSDLLTRALSNLVENALEYGEGDTVRITALAGRISVENGGAIDPEILPRLFDRLFRGDPSRGRRGSGLGLAIAKAVVEAHGGRIRVESDPVGNVTRFTIDFT